MTCAFGGRLLTTTSCSGSVYGGGRSSTALTTLNIAALSATPTDSVSAATSVNARSRNRERAPMRASIQDCSRNCRINQSAAEWPLDERKVRVRRKQKRRG